MAAGLAAWAALSLSAAHALEFRALAPDEGAAVLSARDDFMNALSPADLSLRLRRPEGGNVEALAAHYAANTRPWSPEEIARLDALIARHAALLDRLAPWLPPEIGHIKVTGDVEGGFPHTRAAAIIWGQALPSDEAEFETLFFHELFHILSRHSAARRDELYAIIGFARCTQVTIPRSLAETHLTNPDAPMDWHVAPTEDGRYLMPRASIAPPRYDPSNPGFGEYFTLAFLEMTRDAEGRCGAVPEDEGEGDAVRSVSPPAGAAAIAHVAGRNTNYILHPEEMLADNFAQLMTGRTDIPNPEIHARLAGLLGLTPAQPAAE